VQPQADLYTDRSRADSFGAAARLYDSRRPRYPSQLIADLLSRGAQRVLDVGAGTGIASRQLLDKGADVLAVEPDPRMAGIAKEKGIRVEMGTFENWDPANRNFDLIVFGQSFHWVNPSVALPKIDALLSTGGQLALMWNRLIPTEPTDGDLAEIYRDYMDPGLSLIGGSSIGVSEADGNIDRLTAPITAAGFTVEEQTYPRDEHYSAERWLDLVFTYSSHLILAADKAAELRARLAERIGPRGVSVGGDTLLILATRTRESG
jgi:SAM-dependent methyltransferase